MTFILGSHLVVDECDKGVLSDRDHDDRLLVEISNEYLEKVKQTSHLKPFRCKEMMLHVMEIKVGTQGTFSYSLLHNMSTISYIRL